jgi:hypothetical protein
VRLTGKGLLRDRSDVKTTRNRSDGQSRRDLNVAARPEAPFQRRMNIA